MIRKPDSDRRHLSLPAIKPYECKSPAKILTSLINVSRNICCYRSKFIGSNKRNAIDSIRQIKTLLTFFEEIQYSKSEDLSDSVVLVLSQLHSIFQKLLYVLEDCALEGARLFMLMKSNLVANQFRILIRSVASALDSMCFESIDVPIEVVEHVELMMKQARRAKFEVDREDEEILKEVKSILTCFDLGIIPDNNRIKRVLDYVGIRKWSSCNKEVKFLVSEMEIQWSSEDTVEIFFLSNLVSLMNYSRCILFDVVDYESNIKSGIEIPDCLNPDDFKCPISLDFMIDPVTVATGQTYDRSLIQTWLIAGNSTCPNTRERLINTDVVPNLTLRRIIRQYCCENSIPIEEPDKQNPYITRSLVTRSVIAKTIHRELARFLGRLVESGTLDEKNKAAYEMNLLSKSRIFTRFCAAEIGLIPNLLKLLRSSDVLTQKNAIAAVLNLSKNSKCKRVIEKNNGLEEIVNVLRRDHRIEAKQIAAIALFFMASVEDYRQLIGEIPEAMLGLINLLKHNEDRSKKNAMVTIYGLLTHPENHRKVISAGAVPLLVNLVEANPGRESLVADSMEILESLAGDPEGTAEILRCGGLNSIVQYLGSCSSRTGQQNSVSLLLALCFNGGKEVIGSLSKSQTLNSSLNNMITQGINRTCWKTNSLITYIRDSIDRRFTLNQID